MKRLNNMRFLFFVDDVYEELELWYPVLRLREEGAITVVAGVERGRTYAGKHGYPCKSDAAIDDVKEEDFDGLIIAGGFAPDKLRRIQRVLDLTRSFHEKGKLVAHICHGGWIPVSAKIVMGYRCTSTPGIKDDLSNAGALWSDEPVVVDRNQISSRRPDDLPDFLRAIIGFYAG